MFQGILPLGMLLGLLALSSTPAMANHVDTASATVTCTSYNLAVSASALVPGQSYTITYAITLTPTSGSAVPITGSISFTAPSTGTFSTTVMKPLGPLTAVYTLSGSASLVGFNTIQIDFSSNTVNCAPPPPPPCSAQSTNSSNFNGTPISGGDYIWFNANFTTTGIPSSGTTLTLTNSTISFTAGTTHYNLTVPNARITFSPSATCSSTTFNTTTNTWITTIPIKGDDEIFLTGLAWPVPSGGLPGGIQPVTWTGTFSTETDTPGISMQWKWGAAVYSSFTTKYNQLAIKPGHQTACGQNNGDHAGTPEGVNNNNQPWEKFVVGGAGGGGGSNWTGSWSGTLSVTPTSCANVNDSFNRPNGPVGPNWQDLCEYPMTISGDELAVPSGGSFACGYWIVNTFTSDQFSQAQVPSDTGSNIDELLVRASGNSLTNRQWYQAYWDGSGKIQVGFYANNSSCVGGCYRDIGPSVYQTKNAGDVLSFEVVGFTLNVYVNDVLQISTSDGVLTSGSPGILVQGSAKFDNWNGGNLP